MNPNIPQKTKKVLATCAALGILNHNSAVQLPDSLSVREIAMVSEISEGETQLALQWLDQEGLVRHRNTGYYGYGDHYVDGSDVWTITPQGLIALWV